VVKPPELPFPTPYPDELQQLCEQFMKVSREAVQYYLTELRARIPAPTEIRIVEDDSVSAAIHEMVERENIDLVVLCAHGRTGRINWPYGSVARNYIEHGTQPVLVIQDVPRSQFRPTTAEIAAEKYGRR
jgi:nucleotide-binding universal stress UspA family protein